MRERWKGLFSLAVAFAVTNVLGNILVIAFKPPSDTASLFAKVWFEYSILVPVGMVVGFTYLAIVAWKKPLWLEWAGAQFMKLANSISARMWHS